MPVLDQDPAAVGDQAGGLRRLPRPVQVIAVTSGKGGVGKTNVSVNLSVALAELGHQVLLMDADLSLANVDVMLGLHPRYDLSHVLTGERELGEILLAGPGGIRIVPASSGARMMTELGPREHAGLIQAFSSLSFPLDVMVIDTAAGIADSVVSFCRAAQQVVVVVTDEPTSITDAYALIKLLHREHRLDHFAILANMVDGLQQGRDLYTKINRVTEQYLNVNLDYLGAIPYDEQLRKAVRRQQAVTLFAPRSRSAQAFRQLAERAERWPRPSGASGRLEFFVERLIQADAMNAETTP